MTSADGQVGDLKRRIAAACQVLGRLDLTKAATGHVSARIPATERILVRARGPSEMGVRYTRHADIVEVDFDGRLLKATKAGLEAPIEIFIHTAIYRARPEVNAVVHVHPPLVVLFTICEKPLLPLYGAYDVPSLQMLLAGIPTFDRSILIDSQKLGEDLVHTMGGHGICLMRGHGVTTAASSVEEAALAVIQINELATMNYRAHLLGNPVPISREDRQAFEGLRRDNATGKKPARPNSRDAALWRYYCALTNASVNGRAQISNSRGKKMDRATKAK